MSRIHLRHVWAIAYRHDKRTWGLARVLPSDRITLCETRREVERIILEHNMKGEWFPVRLVADKAGIRGSNGR